jgi:hypothetical protein
MPAADRSNGAWCVLARPDLTLLDTREMAWEPCPGIPGGNQKVLSRDANGVPCVQLTWIPPGLSHAEPSRHYHQTVRERGLVLFGELPMREYASPDDERGRPVVFRQGYYMDRAPGSVHGIDPDVSSAVGFVMLDWRTGPGTYLLEPGADRETVVLPASREIDDTTPLCAADAPAGTVVDSGKLRLLDTRAMAWEVMPGIRGARWKVLSRDDAGNSSAVLIWMAPRSTGGSHERHYHKTVRENGYCLGGELPMREFASVADDVGERVLFREGLYMDRGPGSIHGVDSGRESAVGFTFLEWRSGPKTYLLEDDVASETIVLPAGDPVG